MAATVPLVQTEVGHACPPALNRSQQHAITIHMPTWQALIDFVEQKPEILGKIKNMYPRMMPIVEVAELTKRISQHADIEGNTCLLYPTKLACEADKAFAISTARKDLRLPPELISLRGYELGEIRVYAIFFPQDKTPSVIPYWHNAGVGVSTRFSEACLKHIDSLKEISWDEPSAIYPESKAHQGVRRRMVELLERAPLTSDRPAIQTQDIYLYQTGMAAIYHVHRYLGMSRPGTTILFGFAFHSTPHALEDFGTGYKSFGLGTELDELESFIKDETKNGRRIQGLWAEFPANPLLVTPDLSRLRKMADVYDFPLLIDDTVASFCNVDLLGADGADVLITSLTKSFNGYADVMAGSAVVNPSSRRYAELRKLFDQHYTNELFVGDAEVLLANSQDYLARSKVLNDNAASLVQYLESLSKEEGSPISKIWYPTTSPTLPNYVSRMRPVTSDFTPGYGCLFSIELKTVVATQAFYDNLGKHMHIGPHLGAHITLALAYNKVIYAKDLERIKEFGLSERQVRVSVGLEKTEHLKRVFDQAIEAGRKVMEEEKGKVAALT